MAGEVVAARRLVAEAVPPQIDGDEAVVRGKSLAERRQAVGAPCRTVDAEDGGVLPRPLHDVEGDVPQGDEVLLGQWPTRPRTVLEALRELGFRLGVELPAERSLVEVIGRAGGVTAPERFVGLDQEHVGILKVRVHGDET